jgi:hypothetical protein
MAIVQPFVEGRSFTLDGRKSPFRCRTSFKLPSWIYEYLKGSPHGDNPYDKARRWLERVRRQGFHAVRVFWETKDWAPKAPVEPGDHPFFGVYPWNPAEWNYEELARGQKPLELPKLNREMIGVTLKLAAEFDLVVEGVIDATLKGMKDQDAIDHCFRVTSAYCRDLYLVNGRLNLVVELTNEFDAHYDEELDVARVDARLKRHKRWRKEGEPSRFGHFSPGPDWVAEQWPEGLVWVSHGGRDNVEYSVDFAHGSDAVVVHPSRSGQWWLLDGRFDEIEELSRRKNLPIYFNESKHFIDPKDWDSTVGRGWFSPGSSTSDLSKYREFMLNSLDRGYGFCVHDFEGMASDPDRPETILEKWLREEFGGGAPPPPPPPPSPPPPPPPADDKVKVTVTRDPENRLVNITVDLTENLVTVRGGSEDFVFARRAEVDFGAAYSLVEIRTFLGLDRGDIVEADLYVDTAAGVRVYQRSLHKEVPGNYEAWDRQETVPLRVRHVVIYFGCRVNAKNAIGQDTARYDPELVFILRE